MEEKFDPYLQWLGIRDPKRPPNHYRLLGLDLYESDPEVILNAADRQMTHVRRFQAGKHSAESQQLLNELAAAKICLTRPEKKAAYDTALRQEEERGREILPPPLLRPIAPPIVADLIPSSDRGTRPPAFSNSLPQVAGLGSSAPEVSLPSSPLPLASLQQGKSVPSKEISTDEVPLKDLGMLKKFKGIFYLVGSIVLAMGAVGAGLLVLQSSTSQQNSKPSEPSKNVSWESNKKASPPSPDKQKATVTQPTPPTPEKISEKSKSPESKSPEQGDVRSGSKTTPSGTANHEGTSPVTKTDTPAKTKPDQDTTVKRRPEIDTKQESSEKAKSDRPTKTEPREDGNRKSETVSKEESQSRETTPSPSKTESKEASGATASTPPKSNGSSPKDPRLPVPTEEELATARKQIHELLKGDFSKEKEGYQRVVFSQLLLDRAMQPESAPALRYAYFEEARDQALGAGSRPDFLRISSLMGREFQLDWLEVAAESVTKAAGKSRDPVVNTEIDQLGLDLSRIFLDRGDYPQAEKMTEVVRDAARKNKETVWVKKAATAKKDVETRRELMRTYQAAQTKLAESPDDRVANTAMGKYYAFVRNDWRKALEHWERAKETKLAILAQGEIARDRTPAIMMAMGDKWFELTKQGDEPTRRQARLRATYWYQQVFGSMNGPPQEKLRQRLKELSEAR